MNPVFSHHDTVVVAKTLLSPTGWSLFMRVTFGGILANMESIDYDELGNPLTHQGEIAHYHGDLVRVFFIAAAILILVMQFTGDNLPLTPAALIIFVTVLVVAAGITNPIQRTIHWVNLFVSFVGLALFGGVSIERLHSVGDFFTHNGLAGLIALVFLGALYFATRTVRGNLTGSNPVLPAKE